MKALLISAADPSAQPLRDAVRKALQSAGIDLATPDFDPGASLADVITDAIASADLVIADISKANPNVFYELGYAHALRKNTILLVSKDASPKLPSDLIGTFYRTYDPDHPEELEGYILRTAHSLKQRREALA
jgi:predicted nucleotide-binding protein